VCSRVSLLLHSIIVWTTVTVYMRSIILQKAWHSMIVHSSTLLCTLYNRVKYCTVYAVYNITVYSSMYCIILYNTVVYTLYRYSMILHVACATEIHSGVLIKVDQLLYSHRRFHCTLNFNFAKNNLFLSYYVNIFIAISDFVFYKIFNGLPESLCA
jgi:hypothetical protein